MQKQDIQHDAGNDFNMMLELQKMSCNPQLISYHLEYLYNFKK